MQNNFEPIQVPLGRKLRELRFRYLPVIVFVIVTIAVISLWDYHVTPSSFQGMAESERSLVMSPRPGTVLEISAERFDAILEGEELARVYPVDPSVMSAHLDVILAEVELIRTSLEPLADRQRNLLNYEGRRLDLMNARIELATTRINRDRLQRDLDRADNLYDQNLISEAEYDLIRTEFASNDIGVTEKEKLISEMEERLQTLSTGLIPGTPGSAGDPVRAAINVKEKELNVLEAEMSPIIIRAPISGMISQMYKNNGEFAAEGEPIFTISASGARYVIGFVRQPVSRLPELGATVEVRSRSRRTAYQGQITHVGTQMEPIHESMLRPGQTVEYVLPVRILISPDSDLIPGELVDITVR
ncbi:MAG: HlyD family efflux transporter periplasmic adaptor subunit [Rhodothermaceae bacterium]|nr:HlyD family efflux transporter periplasmic adaptor subunit [Rhodothermaceae bacterium]